MSPTDGRTDFSNDRMASLLITELFWNNIPIYFRATKSSKSISPAPQEEAPEIRKLLNIIAIFFKNKNFGLTITG